MTNYECILCNFKSTIKSNYNRHIQTKKHQLNHEIHVAKSKILPKQCPHCLKKFSTISVKNRHILKNCPVIKKQEAENRDEEEEKNHKKEIKNLRKQVVSQKKKIARLEKENDKLTKKLNKQQQEHLNKYQAYTELLKKHIPMLYPSESSTSNSNTNLQQLSQVEIQ